MKEKTRQDEKKTFISDFHRLINISGKRSSALFSDFIFIFGFELYACVMKIINTEVDEKLLQDYQRIAISYNQEEKTLLSKLFSSVVIAFEQQPYQDFLGDVFMSLDLGDEFKGQFFTPFPIAEFMAQLHIDKKAHTKEFITLSEPTCGSGAMIIAMAKTLQQYDINYQRQLYVEARDIDFITAMMCYIQLTLLHIPATVIVGDTLSNEQRYCFHTLAYVTGNWAIRLMNGTTENKSIEQLESDRVELEFDNDELIFW